MIFDTDDLAPGNDRLDLLWELKRANPAFKLTAFAVQGLGDDDYWNSLPDWIELAQHGEFHPHPREAESWSYEKACEVLDARPPRFVKGWKSPGWQISDGTYQALLERDYWLADQPYNNDRRPTGLRVHLLGDGDGVGDGGHVHTHVQDIGTNGLAESFGWLLPLVSQAIEFRFVSEMVRAWEPQAVAA